MTFITYNAIEIGDTLPELIFGPISRHTLALYCGGSGDHNPIHVDSDFAKQAGFDDVFAHGMLSMAVLARLISGWVKQDLVRSYGVRFLVITQVHDVVTCTGRVTDKFIQGGEQRLSLEVSAHTQDGRQTLKGNAVIACPK